MRVEFSNEAIADLREISAYLSPRHMRGAVRVLDQILNSADMLGDHPELGRIYEDGPERRLDVPRFPYAIYYELHGNTVMILTVLHTSRKPPSFA